MKGGAPWGLAFYQVVFHEVFFYQWWSFIFFFFFFKGAVFYQGQPPIWGGLSLGALLGGLLLGVVSHWGGLLSGVASSGLY